MNQVSCTIKKITKPQWLCIVWLLVYGAFWLGSMHFFVTPVQGSDSQEYAKLAQNLLAHAEFTPDTEAPFSPETFRVVGYPFFAALILAACKSLFAVTLLQTILVLFTSLFIFKIGKKLFSEKVGFIAGLLFLLEPGVIYHSLVVLSDTLFVFLFVAAVYLLFFAEKQTKRSMFSVGLIVGFATLVRPIALYALPIFILFYVWIYWKAHTRRALVYSLTALVIGYIIIVVPWLSRNKSETGVFALSSLTAYNLYHYNAADFLVWQGQSLESARSFIEKETGVSDTEARKLEHSAKVLPVVKNMLISQPFSYTAFHIAKSTPFFLGSSLNVATPTLPKWIMRIEQGIWLLVCLAALWGVVGYRKNKLVLLFAVLIVYFWLLTGPVAYSRYRLPVEPLLFIVAVAAIKRYNNPTI